MAAAVMDIAVVVAAVSRVRGSITSLPQCSPVGIPGPQESSQEPNPATPAEGSFPLTPTYLPPGVSPTPTLGAQEGELRADFDGPYGRVRMGGGEQDISIEISSTDLCYERTYTTTTLVIVHGHRGRLEIWDDDDRSVTVTWQDQPGQWISVSGSGDWSAETMLRVARGLRTRR